MDTAGFIRANTCRPLCPRVIAPEYKARGTHSRCRSGNSNRCGITPTMVVARPLIDELTARGVDPSGELGEYHTIVTNTPLFQSPLVVRARGHVLRSECWALDLELVGNEAAREAGQPRAISGR